SGASAEPDERLGVEEAGDRRERERRRVEAPARLEADGGDHEWMMPARAGRAAGARVARAAGAADRPEAGSAAGGSRGRRRRGAASRCRGRAQAKAPSRRRPSRLRSERRGEGEEAAARHDPAARAGRRRRAPPPAPERAPPRRAAPGAGRAGRSAGRAGPRAGRGRGARGGAGVARPRRAPLSRLPAAGPPATIADGGTDVPPVSVDRPSLHALASELAEDERLQAFADALPAPARVSEPGLPLVLAALHVRLRRSLVCLLPEDADARDAAEAAAWYLGDDAVALLPSRGVRLGSGLEPPPHLVGERARALEVLA